MARIPNIFNRDIPLKDVIISIATIDPDAAASVRDLTKTGKRGRPKSTINAKAVYSHLTRIKALTARNAIKGLVEA